MATVTTCPQRWGLYQEVRRQFERLELGFPLRTFQCQEWRHDPRVNNNLNARAAIAYCEKHLRNPDADCMLYLEDDIVLRLELRAALSELLPWACRPEVGCLYLCNRKTPVRRQFRVGNMVVNELAHPIVGTHALLLPKRHLHKLLAAHWKEHADQVVFGTLRQAGAETWQVVHPVLVEHIGARSTFDPENPRPLEINYADSSNPCPAA